MVTGRPTKYRKSYCKAVVDYFRAGTTKSFPTLAGFCTTIDVCEDTIQEWSRVYPEFSVSIQKAMVYGKDLLIKGSMTSTFNGNFAKFLAINCYGMVEKTETKSDINLQVPTGINVTFISNKE